MLAVAHQAEKGEPFRQCALTRARQPARELIRFCLDPQGHVVPDLKNRLPGRGVWLTANHSAVMEAVRKGVFARGFAARALADETLPAQVDDLLETAALQRLSLANKAGLVVSGFTKVAEALDRGAVAILLHAADAAPGGREKLDRKAVSRPIVVVDHFNSGQLSLALGRSNVVHAAVSDGGACESFRLAADRLRKFRSPKAAAGKAKELVTDTE